MKINLFCIAKSPDPETAHFTKLCASFGGKMIVKNLFSKRLLSEKNPAQILKIYSEIFTPYVQPENEKRQNFALCVEGQTHDSESFAEALKKNEINFFIGGAFGLEENFKNSMQKISLSPLTMSHAVAKIVLCEQIYRALSLKNGHPYHKI